MSLKGQERLFVENNKTYLNLIPQDECFFRGQINKLQNPNLKSMYTEKSQSLSLNRLDYFQDDV